jgi:hypothetical protein
VAAWDRHARGILERSPCTRLSAEATTSSYEAHLHLSVADAGSTVFQIGIHSESSWRTCRDRKVCARPVQVCDRVEAAGGNVVYVAA